MLKKPMLSLLVSLLVFAVCQTGEAKVITGDMDTKSYFPIIKGKRIALFSNQTGMAGHKHVLDLLVENKFNVTGILSPEHGFRGEADAGEAVDNSIDPKTGIKIHSLYGKQRNQSATDALNNCDILIVDIQDVGLRFYTYYATMSILMDRCAEMNKDVLLLDRPNPNGFYVDGPIIEKRFRSGVGWLPIPVVYGMTLGELAQMINGEGWLTEGRKCNLTVIPCKNYTHQTLYKLPLAPSPNLPNMKSIYLYPSLCYFEGTVVSLGRGTDKPFQIYGHPDMKDHHYKFTPRSRFGAKNPPQLNKLCHGTDLSNIPDKQIRKEGLTLKYVIDAYNSINMGDKFFTPFFEKLIGVSYVREMIKQGKGADEIKAMWTDDVRKFKQQRKKYLIYQE